MLTPGIAALRNFCCVFYGLFGDVDDVDIFTFPVTFAWGEVGGGVGGGVAWGGAKKVQSFSFFDSPSDSVLRLVIYYQHALDS